MQIYNLLVTRLLAQRSELHGCMLVGEQGIATHSVSDPAMVSTGAIRHVDVGHLSQHQGLHHSPVLAYELILDICAPYARSATKASIQQNSIQYAIQTANSTRTP